MDTAPQEITEARRGRIILSCGCEYMESMGDFDSLHVRYRTESCDPVDGLANAVGYAVYCPRCREIIADELIHSDDEEQDWLS